MYIECFHVVYSYISFQFLPVFMSNNAYGISVTFALSRLFEVIQLVHKFDLLQYILQ